MELHGTTKYEIYEIYILWNYMEQRNMKYMKYTFYGITWNKNTLLDGKRRSGQEHHPKS